jgi:hypothetical protein
MAVVPVSGPSGGNIVQATPLPDTQTPNRPGTVPISAFGGDQASATAKGAQDLMAVSDQVAKVAISQAQQDGRTKRTNADAALQTGANTILDGDPNDPNDVGFNGLQGQAKIDAAPGVISRLQANRTAALGMVSSLPQPEQDFYAARSATTVSDQLGRVSQAVAQAKGQVSIEASNGRMFATTQAAGLNYSDPQAVQDAFVAAHQESANISKIQGLPPDAAAEQLAITQGHIAQTIVNSALSDDPSGRAAAAVVKQFPTLPAEVTASISNAIYNAQQKAQVAGRATLTAQLNDNMASIARTGAPIHMGISPAQITNVLGADEGARVNQQIADATGLYRAQQSVALTNPTEDAAAIAKLQPGPGSSSVPGLYASQAQDADVLQRTIAQKWSAIGKDPAGYVSQVNPAVASLVQAAQRDPQQWDAVGAEMDRTFDRLGLPPQNRPIMPASVAQGFVSGVMAEPPEQRAQTFSSNLAALPDDATRGRVMGDLVKAGLPPAYETLAAMPNSADQTAMAASIGNAKALRDGLQDGDAKAIDQGIAKDDGLQNLTRSFAFAPGGAVKAGNIVEALKPLAYSFRAQGLSNGDAITRAAHAITGAFDFYDNGGQVARVPAGELPLVEQQANAVLSSLTAPQLAVPANPSGISLTPTQLQGIALENAQRGAWVTNEGGTGLVRIGQNGSPVKLSGGGRLTMPFPSLNPAGPSPGAPAPANGAPAPGTIPGLY